MKLIRFLGQAGKIISFIKYKYDRLRLTKLIKNGLKIGKNVVIQTGVDIDDNYPYLISIEDNCRISIGVRILAHDASTFKDLGITRIEPVKILEGTFIGERAIILPGVTLGPNALIAAGSVVNRDIGAGKIAAGNPARPYGNFSEMLDKTKNTAASKKVYLKKDFECGRITPQSIINEINENGIAFMHGIPNKDPYYLNEDITELRENVKKAYRKVTEYSESLNK